QAGAIDAVGGLLHDGAVVGAGAAQRALGVPARRVFHHDGADAVGVPRLGLEGKVGRAPVTRDARLSRRLARELDVQRGLARLEATAMLRTTEPDVGIFTVSARSVAGSKATIWSVPDSSYQMRPSVPTAMPYGWLPSPPGEAKSRTWPVAGSSRPSLPRA